MTRAVFIALSLCMGLQTPFALAATTIGAPGDGLPSIVYDIFNGNVQIDTDTRGVNTYILQSTSGIFSGAAPSFIGGTIFQTDTNNEISENFFSPTLNGVKDLGNVAASGLQQSFLLNDLTLLGGLAGNPNFTFDLHVIPEPSTLLLAAFALSALAVARRRTSMLQPRMLSGKPAS